MAGLFNVIILNSKNENKVVIMKTIKIIILLTIVIMLALMVLSRFHVIKFGIAKFESTKKYSVVSKSPITTLNHYLSNTNDSILLHRNKTILINFWATWCGPCRKEIPMLNALRERYETQDILFFSTCIDTDENKVDVALQEFEKHYSLKRIELREGALSSLIKLAASQNPTIDTAHAPLPSTFIIKNDSIYFYTNMYLSASDTANIVKQLH